jgi:hypothetical protein
MATINALDWYESNYAYLLCMETDFDSTMPSVGVVGWCESTDVFPCETRFVPAMTCPQTFALGSGFLAFGLPDQNTVVITDVPNLTNTYTLVPPPTIPMVNYGSTLSFLENEDQIILLVGSSGSRTQNIEAMAIFYVYR